MDKKTKALKLALEALEEIALAGMSPAPEMIDSREAFHARQAWRFIGIAARPLSAIKEALAEQPAQQQEPVAYDKTEINCFAQDLYDQKMREGKHGHYESMFHAIHQCIKKVSPPASKPSVWLTEDELMECLIKSGCARTTKMSIESGPYSIDRPTVHADRLFRAIEAKLREKNAQPSKPLTDEQIEQCMKQAYATVQGRNLEHAFARAIEAAHGITGESK